MLFSDIFNYFNHFSKSIGLPPIVLICAIALFFFVFIFGLLVLKKVNRIRKNLIVLNGGLRTLNRKLKAEMAGLKAEIANLKKDPEKLKFQKQAASRSVDEGSNGLLLYSEVEDQNRDRAKNDARPDLRNIELSDNWEKMSDIKDKVMHLLETTGKPISYSEIAKYFSKHSDDHDFELILKELEQLKKAGEIISHVSAGKLYFQKISKH
jgi:cell division protein FtsB